MSPLYKFDEIEPTGDDMPEGVTHIDYAVEMRFGDEPAVLDLLVGSTEDGWYLAWERTNPKQSEQGVSLPSALGNYMIAHYGRSIGRAPEPRRVPALETGSYVLSDETLAEIRETVVSAIKEGVKLDADPDVALPAEEPGKPDEGK